MKIIICALIFLFPSIVNACTCDLDIDIKDIINESAYIFTAGILSVEMCATSDEQLPCVVAKIEILDDVKGNPEFKQIFSGLGGGDCGLFFRVGWRYMFYSDDDTVGICSMSGLYPEGDDDYLEAVKSYVDSGEDFDPDDLDIFYESCD